MNSPKIMLGRFSDVSLENYNDFSNKIITYVDGQISSDSTNPKTEIINKASIIDLNMRIYIEECNSK